MLSDCTGPLGQNYDETLAGAELPLIARGGILAGSTLTDGVKGVSIGGRPVRLLFGCADGTTASALVEARRLVEKAGVDILIGPLSGEEGLVLQEYVRRHPGVAFVNGTASAPQLHPPRNSYSFHTDGAGFMAGLGNYAYRTLGWRTAVTVADEADPLFNWSQTAGFDAEFCSLGGVVVKRIWVPPATQDYSSVIAQIPGTGVDGFFTASDQGTVLALANGYPGLRGNIARKTWSGPWARSCAEPEADLRHRRRRAVRRFGACTCTGQISGRPPQILPPSGPVPKGLSVRSPIPRCDGGHAEGPRCVWRRPLGWRAEIHARARQGGARRSEWPHPPRPKPSGDRAELPVSHANLERGAPVPDHPGGRVDLRWLLQAKRHAARQDDAGVPQGQPAPVGEAMSIRRQIAGYRLEELIGRGGMGVVYRAHDLALERSVALKLLAPELASDVGFRERFLVESRLAASLDHPNVVPIFDAGEVEGQLYLAMRYVQGSDLKELLQQQGALEPARAIQIVSQMAEALDAAHARGLVHRDVKPSNVLLDEAEHAYLADFGLTRRLADQAPGFESGLSLGTPAYVAPEQIEDSDIDGRADQYSLACMLCECLSGEPPFPRSSEAAVLYAHLEERPSVPPGLEQVMAEGAGQRPF